MSVASINTPASGEEKEKGSDLRKIGAHPDHWYPLISSRRLKAGTAAGVTFAGEPIVIVRTGSGRQSRASRDAGRTDCGFRMGSKLSKQGAGRF